MTQERILTRRITRLAVFRVPEFGASRQLSPRCCMTTPTICAGSGNVAQEFITRYRDWDIGQ